MGWLVSHWSPLDMNPTATKPFTGRSLALSVFTAASQLLASGLTSLVVASIFSFAG